VLVSEAIAELRNIDALDLTDSEATQLLNEANVELCVRSRWTVATVDMGPTVAGQETYPLPDEIVELREVYVANAPYSNTDQNTIRRINIGELSMRSYGLWWTSFDGAGAQGLSLYPIPSSAVSLEVLSVVSPPALAADDPFTVPADFHRAAIEYVQGVSLGGSEDDLDRRQVHWDEFERQVTRLRARRITRDTGHTNATLRIRGMTA